MGRFSGRWLAAAWIFALGAAVVISCSDKSTDGGDDGDGDDEHPAPAAITDLHAVDTSTISVRLAWTVPGSNATHGAVRWYDLRYYGTPITASNWSSATEWDAVPPAGPEGSIETITVSGLNPATQYYFAVNCCNAYGNWGGISNVCGVKTVIDAEVNIPDTALESVLRSLIVKPTGPILSSDLVDLIEIRAEARGIQDLTGLEHCVNLVFLHVSENPIADLSPISAMHSLRVLGLRSAQIHNPAALSGLVDLEQLILAGNQISDISSLATLVNLRVLTLGQNASISDISAVGGMTKLFWLNFQNNAVADLSPLQDLDSLQTVYLLYNHVSDLQPLVTNPGIGSGDALWMQGNPLSDQARNVQIPALQARGVAVHF